MSARTFPGPWRVDVTEGGYFVVKDATGFSIFALCHIYAVSVRDCEGSFSGH